MNKNITHYDDGDAENGPHIASIPTWQLRPFCGERITVEGSTSFCIGAYGVEHPHADDKPGSRFERAYFQGDGIPARIAWSQD